MCWYSWVQFCWWSRKASFLCAGTFALCANGLVKLTPGVNFTNILRAAFLYASLFSGFLYLRLRFVFFWPKEIGAKAAYKMLVNYPTGGKVAICAFSTQSFITSSIDFRFWGSNARYTVKRTWNDNYILLKNKPQYSF